MAVSTNADPQLVTLYPNRDHTAYFKNHKRPIIEIIKEDSVTHAPLANASSFTRNQPSRRPKVPILVPSSSMRPFSSVVKTPKSLISV